MKDSLVQTIGLQEAATVKANPTLAFNYHVGLKDPGSPVGHNEADKICHAFGGMVVHRHEGTTVPNNDLELFTTAEGAEALAQSPLVRGLRLDVEFADPQHIYGIKLGQSGRSYDGRVPVKTKIPYRAPPCFD